MAPQEHLLNGGGAGRDKVRTGRWGAGRALAFSEATWGRCDTLFSSNWRRRFDVCMDNSFLINFKLPWDLPLLLEQAISSQAWREVLCVRDNCPWHMPSMDNCPYVAEEKLRCPRSHGKWVLWVGTGTQVSRFPASGAVCGLGSMLSFTARFWFKISVAYFGVKEIITQELKVLGAESPEVCGILTEERCPCGPQWEERTRLTPHTLSLLSGWGKVPPASRGRTL